MEIDYSYQAKVWNTIVTLWHYYMYMYAPRVINNLLSAGILFLVDPCISMPDGLEFMLVWCAGVLIVVSAAEFPVFCWRCIKMARSCGAFDTVTRVSLNEKTLVIRRGNDSGNTSLQSLSGYFIYRNRLFLLFGGKSLMCAINLNEIPENEDCARRIIAKSPVRKQKFLSFRNWYFTLILLVLAALIIFVQYSDIVK